MKYTFGTTNEAASRLEEMGKFFNPVADTWLKPFVPNRVETAIDLGCGPGFTTEMLSHVTKAASVFGLDNSEAFLNLAKTEFKQFDFRKHDITVTPFPIRGDVMYAKFVLAHLTDPVSLANRWISQLCRNGILFIDEMENIETDMDLFKVYLSANTKLVASQGGQLFVGQTLSAGQYNGKVLANDSVFLPVENWRAATWFLPNALTIWRDNAVISKILDIPEIVLISKELKTLIDLHDNRSNITWKMRQVAVQRDWD